MVFAIAVALLVGLSLFLRRTQLGRLMRATSDDQETARLMGVDSRNMYAFATAIAFATVALAGVLNGVQTNFSPASGPTLLIFAFEAVIIGGLGSLWGTLLGGIVLGVAQNVGAWIEPAQQVLAGHLVFLLVLASVRRGCSRRAPRHDRARDSSIRATTSTRVSGGGLLVLGVVALAMLPYVVVPSQVFGVIDLLVFVVLATMWNLLAGYGGMVSVGQQAYIGIGAYGLVYLADQLGVNAFLAVPLVAVHRRRDRPSRCPTSRSGWWAGTSRSAPG